jgi:hypothetical protein
MNKIKEIEKLKSLLDSKVISKEQYDVLLNNLIGENKKSKEKELLENGAITQEQYNVLVNNQTDTAHTTTSHSSLSNVNQGNQSQYNQGNNSHQHGDSYYQNYTNKNIYEDHFNIKSLDSDEVTRFKKNNFYDTSSPGLGIFLNIITLGLFCFFSTASKHGKFNKLRQDDITGGAAVGFLFVPFYNLYWLFKMQLLLVKRINFQFKLRNQPPPLSASLATIACIGSCIPFIQYISFLIIFPIYYYQVQTACNRLAEFNRHA